MSYQYKTAAITITGKENICTEIENIMNQCSTQGWEYYSDISLNS